VKDAADALRRLRESGVDGVMIGRGAMANPWIFLQIAQLRHGERPFEPTTADKRELLLRYLEMCLAEMPERLALNKLKQLIGQFAVGLPGSAALREAVHRSTEAAAARDHIERFLPVIQFLELRQHDERGFERRRRRRGRGARAHWRSVIRCRDGS